MSVVRSKICGITHIEDALFAVEHGADALGFVFYPPSPRAVSAEQVADILSQLPPFVTTVGLFVDAKRAEVEAVLAKAPLDILQFHGDETPAQCEGFMRPYIKAIRMRDGISLEAQCLHYQSAAALLLDTYVAGVPGGTGEAFDWARIPADLTKPVILAGGLEPMNVERAMAQVRPYAVDVSGGVERSKGRKDSLKVAAFLSAVRQFRM